MKKTAKFTIIVVVQTFVFMLLITKSKAQDVHFTMYDVASTTVNPATSGVFNGDFRGVLNYRNQWASIGNPYSTYSLQLDGGIFKSKWRNGYLGVGLGAYKDRAGSTNFGTTKINLALSSIIYLDGKNSAAVGLMGSWVQNSIDPNNLRWDSQFNGQTFNASSPTFENFTYNNSNYFDFSVGALWAYGTGAKTLSSQDEFKTKVGFAFYHITRPNNQLEYGEEDRLYSRYSIHSETHIGISNTKLALRPKTLVSVQGLSLIHI